MLIILQKKKSSKIIYESYVISLLLIGQLIWLSEKLNELESLYIQLNLYNFTKHYIN